MTNWRPGVSFNIPTPHTFWSANSATSIQFSGTYTSSVQPWKLEDELKSIMITYKDQLSPEDIKALNKIVTKCKVKQI